MKEKIISYLEKRIKELYNADEKFCEDRWNMSKGANERGIAREFSNQVTFARQELQAALRAITSDTPVEKCKEIPQTIMIFSNGNICAFDKAGQQMGEFQEGWMNIYFKWLEERGCPPDSIKNIETIVNGRKVYIQPFRTEHGWNANIVDF